MSSAPQLPTNNTSINIDDINVIDEFATIVDVYGQGCNYPTKQGVENFRVDFSVTAIKEGNEKSFNVVYSTMERTDNIMAYNGLDMALDFDCDSNESSELEEFMGGSVGFESMAAIAKKKCSEWFESNCE